MRSEGSYRLRPAFPGTAVVLGERRPTRCSRRPSSPRTASSSTACARGPRARSSAIASCTARRSSARRRPSGSARAVRDRARPWRVLLYPLVGLLPEEEQERLCDRLGLYAVDRDARLRAGRGPRGLLVALVPRRSATARPAPSWCCTALARPRPARAAGPRPGVRRRLPARDGRLGARRLRVRRRCEALGALRSRVTTARFVPLTRAAFWERLARPDDGRDRSPTARSSSAACCRTSRGAARGGSRRPGLLERRPRSRPRSARGGSSTRIASSRSASPGPRRAGARRSARRRLRRGGPRAGAARVGRAQRGLRVAHLPCSRPMSRRAPSTTAAGPRPRVARRWPPPWRPASSALYVLSFLPGPPGDPLGPFLGCLRPRAPDRRGAAVPRDSPGPLRAEPLPLSAPLGLAAPRAPGLACPPGRGARSSRSNGPNLTSAAIRVGRIVSSTLDSRSRAWARNTMIVSDFRRSCISQPPGTPVAHLLTQGLRSEASTPMTIARPAAAFRASRRRGWSAETFSWRHI